MLFPSTPETGVVACPPFQLTQMNPILHLSAGGCQGQQQLFCSPALLGDAGRVQLPQPHAMPLLTAGHIRAYRSSAGPCGEHLVSVS